MNDSATSVPRATLSRLFRWIAIPPGLLTLWHWFWRLVEWVGNVEVVREHLPRGFHIPTIPSWFNTALPFIGIAWLSLLVFWPKKSEFAPPAPNLVFSDMRSCTSYLVGDEFCLDVSVKLRDRFPQRRIILVEIKNASHLDNPDKPVGIARSIKAELVIKPKGRREIYGPLPWAGIPCNTVSIELGEAKQIILAVNFPASDWNLPRNSRSRADDAPGAMKVDYQMLQPRSSWTGVLLNILEVKKESGRTMKTFKGRYRWQTDTPRPEFVFDLD